MNKKGFTLIELLAVIVILAIIALIATPAVLNIIEDSRKGAAEASARNIVSAAKTYYMSETMNGRTISSIDLSKNTLKYDGDQATKGTIIFEDGKALGKMYVGGYCVEVAVDGNVTSEKMNEAECSATPTITYKTYYNDGDYVYFNPIEPSMKCTGEDVETNYNNYRSTHVVLDYWDVEHHTIAGLKEGCMKWYAFLDSEESSTVNLLLDHNTTRYAAWGNAGETTPTLAMKQLAEDVTGWDEKIKSTARLISALEINQIAPTASDHEWIINDSATWYWLHTGNKKDYTLSAGENKYGWLFDNTYDCTTYGCNVADGGEFAYWTSNAVAEGEEWGCAESVRIKDWAWGIDEFGDLDGYDTKFADYYGIRPVITVPKSIFK